MAADTAEMVTPVADSERVEWRKWLEDAAAEVLERRQL
jgi:hypothetical protein